MGNNSLETEIQLIPFSEIVLLSEWAQTLLTIGNVIVLIFAICGNLAAIVIILRSRLSKKYTKWFLLTLAFSDIVLALSSIPADLGIVTSQYHSWVLGGFICENVAFFQTQAVMMNAFSLFAIALDRYLSVIRSMERPITNRKWGWLPYIGLFCIFIIPTGTAAPQFWSYQLYGFKIYNDVGVGSKEFELISNDTFYICYERVGSSYSNTVFYCSLAIVFLSLLIGFLFCYLSIIRFIKTHGNKFNRRTIGPEVSTVTTSDITLSSSSLQNHLKSPKNRHQRTVRLIMTLILIFCICRLPVFGFVVVVNVRREIQNTRLTLSLMQFLHLLSNLNTALSPLLYAVWNDSLKINKKPKEYHRNDGNSTSSKYLCFPIRRKKVNESDRFPIFTINRVKTDRYDFTSQLPSNKVSIIDDNGLVWKRTSTY